MGHTEDFILDEGVERAALCSNTFPPLSSLLLCPLHRLSQLLDLKLCENEKSHCLPGSTTP